MVNILNILSTLDPNGFPQRRRTSRGGNSIRVLPLKSAPGSGHAPTQSSQLVQLVPHSRLCECVCAGLFKQQVAVRALDPKYSRMMADYYCRCVILIGERKHIFIVTWPWGIADEADSAK